MYPQNALPTAYPMADDALVHWYSPYRDHISRDVTPMRFHHRDNHHHIFFNVPEHRYDSSEVCGNGECLTHRPHCHGSHCHSGHECHAGHRDTLQRHCPLVFEDQNVLDWHHHHHRRHSHPETYRSQLPPVPEDYRQRYHHAMAFSSRLQNSGSSADRSSSPFLHYMPAVASSSRSAEQFQTAASRASAQDVEWWYLPRRCIFKPCLYVFENEHKTEEALEEAKTHFADHLTDPLKVSLLSRSWANGPAVWETEQQWCKRMIGEAENSLQRTYGDRLMEGARERMAARGIDHTAVVESWVAHYGRQLPGPPDP